MGNGEDQHPQQPQTSLPGHLYQYQAYAQQQHQFLYPSASSGQASAGPGAGTGGVNPSIGHHEVGDEGMSYLEAGGARRYSYYGDEAFEGTHSAGEVGMASGLVGGSLTSPPMTEVRLPPSYRTSARGSIASSQPHSRTQSYSMSRSASGSHDGSAFEGATQPAMAGAGASARGGDFQWPGAVIPHDSGYGESVVGMASNTSSSAPPMAHEGWGPGGDQPPRSGWSVHPAQPHHHPHSTHQPPFQWPTAFPPGPSSSHSNHNAFDMAPSAIRRPSLVDSNAPSDHPSYSPPIPATQAEFPSTTSQHFPIYVSSPHGGWPSGGAPTQGHPFHNHHSAQPMPTHPPTPGTPGVPHPEMMYQMFPFDSSLFSQTRDRYAHQYQQQQQQQEAGYPQPPPSLAHTHPPHPPPPPVGFSMHPLPAALPSPSLNSVPTGAPTSAPTQHPSDNQTSTITSTSSNRPSGPAVSKRVRKGVVTTSISAIVPPASKSRGKSLSHSGLPEARTTSPSSSGGGQATGDSPSGSGAGAGAGAGGDDRETEEQKFARNNKKVTEEATCDCRSCGIPLAKLFLRGRRIELAVPHVAAYTCMRCLGSSPSPKASSGGETESGASSGGPTYMDALSAAAEHLETAGSSSSSTYQHPAASVPTPIMHLSSRPKILQKSSFRKRTKRSDGTNLVSCDVCLRDTASGAVVVLATDEVVDFAVEFVCMPCNEKYRRCSDCGGGGGARLGVGKWRAKELFPEMRKTCQLSHLRLGLLSDMCYEVWAVRDIPKEESQFVVDKCGALFKNTMLAGMCIPEVMEAQAAIVFDFEAVNMMAERGWQLLQQLIQYDIEPAGHTRRYLALRTCVPNLRKGNRQKQKDQIQEDLKQPQRFVIQNGKDLAGFILCEYDFNIGTLFFAVVVPWATGEVYDATTLLIQTLLRRVEDDRTTMNEERAMHGLPFLPPIIQIWTMMFFKRDSRMMYHLIKRRGFLPLPEYVAKYPDTDMSVFAPARPIYLPVERQDGWQVLVRRQTSGPGGDADWQPKQSVAQVQSKSKEKRAQSRREAAAAGAAEMALGGMQM
ncbi:hypothetical protein T439DRAFT_110851 [Meredithblackwellia eburnea MCA 4105]